MAQSLSDLEDQLRSLGLERKGFANCARWSSRLQLTRATAPFQSIGGSKVGGTPDLPVGTPWPRNREGRPLAFLMQVNLSDLPQHPTDPRAPRDGRLWFFFDTVEPRYGHTPTDDDAFAVIHSEATAHLHSVETPATDGERLTDEFEPCTVTFVPDLSLPVDHALDLNPKERANFFERFDPGLPLSRLFGYASALQEPMEVCCDFVAQGGQCDAIEAELRGPLLKDARERWTLLLQLDSEPEAAIGYGGGRGRLYFWIPAADLRAAKFERTWAILQTT